MTNRKQRLIECVKPLIHTHTHKCTLKKVEEESEGVEHPLKKQKTWYNEIHCNFSFSDIIQN